MKKKYTFIYAHDTGKEDDIIEEWHDFSHENFDYELLAQTRGGDIGVVFKEGSYYVFARSQQWFKDKKDVTLERVKFKTKQAAMMYALMQRKET